MSVDWKHLVQGYMSAVVQKQVNEQADGDEKCNGQYIDTDS